MFPLFTLVLSLPLCMYIAPCIDDTHIALKVALTSAHISVKGTFPSISACSELQRTSSTHDATTLRKKELFRPVPASRFSLKYYSG